MSSPLTPTPTKTTSGNDLPFLSIPQTRLLSINVDEIPTLENALGEGVNFKPLRIDIELGEWVVLAEFKPGARIPLHYHTGGVDAYTMSGSWHYLEYPDQVQSAGSYLFEPGGSTHTLYCPESNTEDTVVFFRIHGANVNFDEDGNFHSILDAVLVKALTHQLAAAQGVEPFNYLEGGAYQEVTYKP